MKPRRSRGKGTGKAVVDREGREGETRKAVVGGGRDKPQPEEVEGRERGRRLWAGGRAKPQPLLYRSEGCDGRDEGSAPLWGCGGTAPTFLSSPLPPEAAFHTLTP